MTSTPSYNVSTRITESKHRDLTNWIAEDDGGGSGGDWSGPLPAFVAVGGAPGRVELRSLQAGDKLLTITPFGPSYRGAIAVAAGDVNRDGVMDLVVGAAGGNPHVKVYSGAVVADVANSDWALLASFFPFATAHNVGAHVAVGDVNGDGWDDIIAGATGGNPHVKVFSGWGLLNGGFGGIAPLSEFFAYGLQFNIGAHVASGDIDRDGYDEVITGATGGNPHVKVYNGRALTSGWASPSASFFAFATQFNVGAHVATGDINGDGYTDLLAGATGGNAHVKVYDGRALALGPFQGDVNLLTSFFAFAAGFNVGVRVGATDYNGDGRDDFLLGASQGAPHVRIMAWNPTGAQPTTLFDAIPSIFQGGVFIGG
jgi:hypothetical protein